ncbi:hypothetical protein [Metabacillus halosaccharovorans]|uniref:DUF4025 domain-containing protein n=1 Tax=Metabacillus halosaccharovorans TaxID=930124 RepID=A0ABT3DNF2_9BACI|nr:hypothetical protein [Metabacillus halosaccharovorans]MCV9888542.1 hypothetical protein [Metabacillus halosaccharovorans]
MKDKQFQDDLDQYKMPDAVKNAKKGTYMVGYEASTGNKTDQNHEVGKKV